MSAFNLTNSRIDLSQINDDDLNLDLDDDDEEEMTTTTNKLKKPVTIEADKNNNFNENDEDNTLFKIPKVNNNLDESIVGGFQKNLETTLNDLFENDQDEDEEDFLIRTQPMFSSTQSNSQRVFSPPENHKKSPEKQNEIIISTQSVGELMMKKNNRLDETILVENLENDKTDFSVWKYAQHMPKYGF